MSFIDEWKEWSTAKKAISILVVCCIGLIIISVLTGGGSPDKNTATAPASDNNTTSTGNDTSNDSSNNTENSTTDEAKGVQVKVTYSGKWSGAIGSGGSSNTVSGTGDKVIDLDEGGIVSANAQKQDASSETLKIQILKDGKVIEEASTDSEYGVASVSGFA